MPEVLGWVVIFILMMVGVGLLGTLPDWWGPFWNKLLGR